MRRWVVKKKRYEGGVERYSKRRSSEEVYEKEDEGGGVGERG